MYDANAESGKGKKADGAPADGAPGAAAAPADPYDNKRQALRGAVVTRTVKLLRK